MRERKSPQPEEVKAEDAKSSQLPLEKLPEVSPGRGFDLLEGVRVLDLTTSIAGPYATQLLGDMGAEILKIEKVDGGDDARAWGPPFLDNESLWFMSVNRNKRSICLDYKQPEGRNVLYELMQRCDVVVTNRTLQVATKLGIDYESVRRIKPDIIYVSITGYGTAGPRANWTCYDLIAEGHSGVMDLTGEADRGPQKVGAPAADMLAGQDAALATVSALFARQKSKAGHQIDIALVDSMTRFLSTRIVSYLGSGDLPRRAGGTDSVISIHRVFETADLPIALAIGNDSIWRRFWEAVGQPEVAHRQGYDSNTQRRARQAEIVPLIQNVLKQRRRDQWLPIFQEKRVPAGPINRIDEVVADGLIHDRGMFYRLKTAEAEFPQVGTGFLLDGAPNHPRHAPPRLGQHTSETLRDLLGYDDKRVEQLRKAGLVQG